MFSSFIELLVMINPFALFLYLEPVRKDLNRKDFLRVIMNASLISLVICIIFFFSGEFIFDRVLQIEFESFRIFGGIIIFSYAYFYIIRGQKALIMIKENLSDLASEIALPFMVGAGTISLSILISYRHIWWQGSLVLVAVYATNFLLIFLFTWFRSGIGAQRFRTAFDKNMEVLLRLNGFFIGAIGINMIFSGIQNLFSMG